MKKVLIVCTNKAEQKKLAMTASEQGAVCTILSSSSAARRAADSSVYDLIIIKAPLSDEFGRELALKFSESLYSEIIFLCAPYISSELSETMSSQGITVLASNCEKHLLSEKMHLSFESRERMMSFNSEYRKIQSRSEEIKLIGRAKKALMSKKGLTEPQAHRFIEKKAMDTRKTRLEIASGILSEYVFL